MFRYFLWEIKSIRIAPNGKFAIERIECHVSSQICSWTDILTYRRQFRNGSGKAETENKVLNATEAIYRWKDKQLRNHFKEKVEQLSPLPA